MPTSRHSLTQAISSYLPIELGVALSAGWNHLSPEQQCQLGVLRGCVHPHSLILMSQESENPTLLRKLT